MPHVTVQVQQYDGASLPADALRGASAARSSDARSDAANPPTARTVERYDFRRPSTLAREHSRVLEVAFDSFARQWGTQLTAKVRVMAHVSCEQVLMLRYDDYAASLPSTTAMVLCRVAGSEAKAVVQFPPSAGLAWVSSMLGGAPLRDADDRRFTAIEQALVRRVMDDTVEDLSYSLGSLCPAAIEVDAIHHTSHFAQAASTSEPMIVARFAVRVGDSAASATVAIPAAVVLPQLGSTVAHLSTDRARELMRAQLPRVPVTVDVRFAEARVTPERVLTLAVGDVLPLPHPHHRPVDVTVDGTVIARAAVGTSGARLACIVVTTEENPA